MPIRAAPDTVGTALTLPLVATAGLLLVSRLRELRQEFFGPRRYAEQSAHTVLEIPARLLVFAALYVGVVTAVGGRLLFALGLVTEAGVAVPAFDAGACSGCP